MTKREWEQYKIDQVVRVVFFVSGLGVAATLALAGSPFTTAAFTFVGGLLGGSVLERKR